MNVEMHLVTDETSLDELSDAWQGLWQTDPQASLFTSWHWQRLWWEHYGRPDTLHVLVFRVGADIVGIVPLYRASLWLYRVVPLPTLRWMGTGGDTTPDDLGMLCVPEYRHRLAQLTLDHLFTVAGVERVLLSDLAHDSALLQVWQQRPIPQGAHRRAVPDTALRFTTLPHCKSEYRQQISRNTHKKMKQRRNRMHLAGDVDFALCGSPEQLTEASQALIELHRARQASKGQAGGFGTERYVAFHASLMQCLLQREELWLATLRLNGQIVAVEYAWCVASTLSFFQTGFDPEHEALSPGHVLMSWMIERAIEAGVQRLELLRGDYPYKASYAGQVRHTSTIDLIRPGWRARVRRLGDWLKAISAR